MIKKKRLETRTYKIQVLHYIFTCKDLVAYVKGSDLILLKCDTLYYIERHLIL